MLNEQTLQNIERNTTVCKCHCGGETNSLWDAFKEKSTDANRWSAIIQIKQIIYEQNLQSIDGNLQTVLYVRAAEIEENSLKICSVAEIYRQNI